MNYAQAISFLNSLGNEITTAKLGLGNMRTLLNFLGHPQKKFPAVLIAGTNGKGAVAAFTESIMREAGYRTGLYTSPHLIKLLCLDHEILHYSILLHIYRHQAK